MTTFSGCESKRLRFRKSVPKISIEIPPLISKQPNIHGFRALIQPTSLIYEFFGKESKVYRELIP